MHRRPTRILPWVLTAAWAAAIFIVSSIPGTTLPGGYSVQGHAIEYFVLGALLTWALSDDGLRPSVIAIAVLLASAYGVTDEFHQRFVPMRTPAVSDWLLDTVGAAAGALVAYTLLARSARRRADREDGAGG